MRSSLTSSAPAIEGLDGAAVAQDGDGIGDLRDLVELVRDQDRGDALRLELEQQVQKRVAVLLVQACGRLVEDQELHLLGQRLGDLDELLLADAEIGDQRLGRLAQAHHLEQLLRAREGQRPVDDAVFGLLVAEEDVLRDRQERHQGQFLVDDDDAELLAVGDAREAALLALVNGSRRNRSRADRRRSAPSSASTCRRRSRRPAHGSRRP